MNSTTFHPEIFPKEKIAPTEYDEWRGRLIQGEVHDESTYTLQKKYYLGAAGLFSTVPDLLTFQFMLLNNGTYEGVKYFSQHLVEQMAINQLPDSTDEVGLGWVLKWSEAMGNQVSSKAFAKSGFTGCFMVTDPDKGLAMTLLCNRTFPKRPADSSTINKLRRELSDLVFAD